VRPHRGLLPEALLAAGISAAVAVVMTWPTVAHPATTVPEDLGDPLLQTWQAAWGGHALLTRPWRVFDANIFYPLRNSLATSDTLLGYAPAGMIGNGPTAALVRYNLLYVVAFALAGLGAYLLARQLGVRPVAAAVAGAGYAYAPWRISHTGHLNVLSSGGIPLALGLLARGHGLGRRGPGQDRASPGCAAAGWAVAAWQLTLGFGIGLPFAYVLGLVTLAALAGWFVAGRPPVPSRLLLADALGLAGFVAVGLLLALPYLRIAHQFPQARRDVATLQLFSPPVRGFLTAPGESVVWGARTAARRTTLGWPPEMTLFPGLVVTVLAATGLVTPTWSVRRRLVIAFAGLAAGVLALGTTLAGGRWTYLPMLEHAPGWAGLRTPGRLVLYVSLGLALLAAAGVEGVAVGLRRPRVVTAVGMGLTLAILIEGVGSVPHPRPVVPPAVLPTVRDPLLILPSDDIADDTAVFWSTAGFPRVANGPGVAFPVPGLERLRVAVASFPDTSSVAALRAAGIRTVLLRRDQLPGTPWAGALTRPTRGLGLHIAVDGEVVVVGID
jgi:hypothetical protein